MLAIVQFAPLAAAQQPASGPPAQGSTLAEAARSLPAEGTPLSRVVVTGGTQLPAELIHEAFLPLDQAGAFSEQLFAQALRRINQAYAERGLLGSGVNIEATELRDGTLLVMLTELRVGAVDTGALGDLSQPLATQAGRLLNENQLAADVRVLSNALGRPVSAVVQPVAQKPNVVNVRFTAGEPAGVVREVRVAGATVIAPQEIAARLGVRLGDAFNLELAQRDLRTIQRLFRERGYEVSARDAIRFEDGVLTYTVRQVRIGGFELLWDGAQRTQQRVILQELPRPGELLDAAELRRTLQNLAQLELVEVQEVTFQPDPNDPERVIVNLRLKELPTTTFFPGVSYDTVGGLNGELAFAARNLFGLGHALSATVTAAPSEVGEYFSVNTSYVIPRLELGFLGAQRERTTLRIGAYSDANRNISLAGPEGPTGREITQRATGAGISLERPIRENLILEASVSAQSTRSILEPRTAEGQLEDALVGALVPGPGFTLVSGLKAGFDSAVPAQFPTSGYRANASAAVGTGFEGDRRLTWLQFDGGARTYAGLGAPGVNRDFREAFAVRANAGTLVGQPPVTALYRVGGSGLNEALTLRGYEQGEFVGSNYFTASAEYRVNLGVRNELLHGLYGVAFFDVGDAWGVQRPLRLKTGFGAGVQANLGFFGATFPALRFDLAFSPANNRTKFAFRLGGFF